MHERFPRGSNFLQGHTLSFHPPLVQVLMADFFSELSLRKKKQYCIKKKRKNDDENDAIKNIDYNNYDLDNDYKNKRCICQ